MKPRLEKAEANCGNIFVIDETDASLSMLDERIEKAIVEKKAKLLILDPIQAYLGGKMDMNRANEARDMTKHLGQVAERTGCAIVLIGHMNKNSGGKVAYRGMGSIDFFAVARSVLLVGRVKGQENRRAMVQIKTIWQSEDMANRLCCRMVFFVGKVTMISRKMNWWAGLFQNHPSRRKPKKCFLVSVISIERCRHQIFGKRHRKRGSPGELWS